MDKEKALIKENSIEEDIKRLEEISKCFTYSMWTEDTSALRRILQDYTRQKQINEEHKKENGLLREKVKELEKANRILLVEKENWHKEETEQDKELAKSILKDILKNDYIEKQKIKDLKENIILQPVIVGGRRNGKTLEYGVKLGKIKACEELLQESEDK